MDNRSCSITRLARDQNGQATIEYTLILAGIGLPLFGVFLLLLGLLTEHYKMVVFLQTLPMP